MNPTNPIKVSGPKRVGPSIDGDASQNGSSMRASSAHNAKMATQTQQLKGAGATTGGLATGGSARVSNKSGRFAAKGMN